MVDEIITEEVAERWTVTEPEDKGGGQGRGASQQGACAPGRGRSSARFCGGRGSQPRPTEAGWGLNTSLWEGQIVRSQESYRIVGLWNYLTYLKDRYCNCNVASCMNS